MSCIESLFLREALPNSRSHGLVKNSYMRLAKQTLVVNLSHGFLALYLIMCGYLFG